MEAYLTATSDKLKSGNFNDLHIVLGNESCDLDSAVSALVYGAFLDWQYAQIKCKVCTKVHRDEAMYKDDIFVPILNVDREDFALKTEVAYCLKEHNFDPSKLIFREDYDLKQLVTTNKTYVTLVDHHILAKRDQFLAPYVTEIIDHRPIDKAGWRYKDETRTTLEVVGSCCTLVAERLRNLGALLSKDIDFFKAYPICTDLLHSCIILDTVNFSQDVNKATPHDIAVVEFLESILQTDNVEETRKSKLDRLVDARRDVSSLNALQLIKKDFKVFGDILVPSFPVLVEEFLQKPDAIEAINTEMVRNECTITLLLGMSLCNELQRDVAVFSPDKEKTEQLATRLQESTVPLLKLQIQELPYPGVIYFKQKNLAASRKQYIPIVNEFLASTK